MKRFSKIVRKAIRKVVPMPEYVEVDGSVIASPDRRYCGPQFIDDNFYLESAEGEANRLVSNFACTEESRVLDVGCGQGRLPIGISRVVGDVTYTGIDVDLQSVEWCQKYIGEKHTSYQFKHLDLYNERYNNTGVKLDESFQFDVEDKSIDIAYLFSVFSHTTETDMRAYLKDFLRVLDDNGALFFTTFVEEGVPDITINPENYGFKISGPLHVVRYNKPYLLAILEEYGYQLVKFTHRTEADGQSAIYLRKGSS
jgi:SAM-dependent methyltransferase